VTPAGTAAHQVKGNHWRVTAAQILLTQKKGDVDTEYYADVLGSAKEFFAQGSAGYKLLQVAEVAYRAYQLVASLEGITAKTVETTASVALDATATGAAATRAVANKHYAALPLTGVAQFVKQLRDTEGISARALEFLVLTAARSGEVRGATPDRVRTKSKRPGLYADGGGLYLRVTPPAACSWVFRYMINGKAREMGLGSFPEVPLQKDPRDKKAAPGARELAARWRRVRAEGSDPLAVREAERTAVQLEAARAMTFRQCAESYIAAHSEGWKNLKHTCQWHATLEAYVYPVFGNLPANSVDVALVTQVLDPIWTTKTETASRLRGRIEAILDWARTRGFRDGENPARWRGHLENIFPARSAVRPTVHFPALPFEELQAFMTDLGKRDGVGADALKFTILTASRTNQTIGARWEEIDLQNGIWTVPGERMKGIRARKREHRVPLSKPA
jgi:integrase